MRELLTRLERTYSERCDNHAAQKNAWEEIAALAAPGENLAAAPRFSRLLAEEAGDLGLALLWIVQSALIRSLRRELLALLGDAPSAALLAGGFAPATIGALAHSEERTHPAIMSAQGGTIRLTGIKKYITGGLLARVLLVTARRPGEEKISGLLLVPAEALHPGSLREISLGSLRTTSHGRLELDGLELPAASLLPVPPGELRRMLKRWSIVERGLILEAILGLSAYIVRSSGMAGAPGDLEEKTLRLLREQEAIATMQVSQAAAGGTVEQGMPDPGALFALLKTLQEYGDAHAGDLPEPARRRFADLGFIRTLMPPRPGGAG